MKKSLVIILLLAAATAQATVEEVYTNPRFKLLHTYVVEDSPYIGLGWIRYDAPESKYTLGLKDLEAQGYRWVKFPYWSELILFAGFILLTALSGSRINKRIALGRKINRNQS